VTGRVPFSGNNGPSILLEILTKDPKPPSEVGRGQKHPVPPTLDAVMAQAFKKMPAMRTPSTGALADAVAQAYGLEGPHVFWATVPEADIAARIQANLPRLMQTVSAPRAPADAADSFFGEDDSLAAGAQVPPVPPAAGYAMQGYGSPHVAPPGGYGAPPSADLAAAGIPTKGPPWLLLALVGGGALVLGGMLVVLFLLLALPSCPKTKWP